MNQISILKAVFIFTTTLLYAESMFARNTIRIGGLATLEGNFHELGKDGMRGMEIALAEFNYTVAGKKIKLIKAGSDGDPSKAVAAARKLIELDNVDILVGPLSGSEGLAIKEYAKTMPNKTFINGTSAAQDTTLRDPAPNFFRFSPDGVQFTAGLGSYVYKVKKYRRMAIISEDYSYPYAQVFGFMHEFCGQGGRVVKKFWTPVGETDYTEVIYSIPEDIDAIFVMLGGNDALNFLSQYYRAKMNKPIVASSLLVSQSVLATKSSFRKKLIGIPTSGPIADANKSRAWKKFAATYRKKFPKAFHTPTLFANFYYVGTKAALLALRKVKGDLSGGQKKFRKALSKLTFTAPTGKIRLDKNRNAIVDIFLTEVAQKHDGSLYKKLIKVIPQVNQTLGMPHEKFLKLGKTGRDNPTCP